MCYNEHCITSKMEIIMEQVEKRLTILSDEEKFAFYGLPDFDDEQRTRYFTFDENELDLIFRCKEFHAQVYCAIQIGYFKAKNMFFKFGHVWVSSPFSDNSGVLFLRFIEKMS